MTFSETLLISEVTVSAVFFLILPVFSALKGERVYLSQGYVDSIRIILYLFLAEIAALLVASYFEYFPPADFGGYTYLISETFYVTISIAFFLTLVLVLRIGYRLLSKITSAGG